MSDKELSQYDGDKPQLWLGGNDLPEGLRPGDGVSIQTKGNSVIITPAGEDTHVPAEEKRHGDSVYPINMEFSEFEARVIAHRLWEAAESYGDSGREHAEIESKWLSRRFMQECKTREIDGTSMLSEVDE